MPSRIASGENSIAERVTKHETTSRQYRYRIGREIRAPRFKPHVKHAAVNLSHCRSVRRGGMAGYFDFLAGSAGSAMPHGSYFSLEFRNPFERGLVGLLIDGRLLLFGLLFLAAVASWPWAWAGMASNARSSPHVIVRVFIVGLPATIGNLTLQSNYGKPRSTLHEASFPGAISAIVDDAASASNGGSGAQFLTGGGVKRPSADGSLYPWR